MFAARMVPAAWRSGAHHVGRRVRKPQPLSAAVWRALPRTGQPQNARRIATSTGSCQAPQPATPPKATSATVVMMASAAFGALMGAVANTLYQEYAENRRQLQEQTRLRDKLDSQVAQAAKDLGVALEREEESRAAFLIHDTHSCKSLLQAANTFLDRATSVMEGSSQPLECRVYDRVAKQWAQVHGCRGAVSPPASDDDARDKLIQLRAHIRYHLAACEQLEGAKVLDNLLASLRVLEAVTTKHKSHERERRRRLLKAYDEQCRTQATAWEKMEHYCKSTGDVDFFTIRGRNNQAVAAHAHGHLADDQVVDQFMLCASEADELSKAFTLTATPETVGLACAQLVKFLDKKDTNLPGQELAAAMAVGEKSVVDVMFLPELTSPSPRENLERLQRTKLTWRKCITARANALWTMSTSFSFSQKGCYAPEDVAGILCELGSTMGVVKDGELPTLLRLHGLYTDLDNEWLKKQGGATRVLVAMAAALELLIRHHSMPDAAAAEEETRACLDACVALGGGICRRQLAQSTLVQALLDSKSDAVGAAALAGQAVREFEDGDGSFRNARERAWAAFVHQVLASSGR